MAVRFEFWRFLGRCLTGVVASYFIASLSLGGRPGARHLFWSLAASTTLIVWFLSWRRRALPWVTSPQSYERGAVLERIGLRLTLGVLIAEGALRARECWLDDSPVLRQALGAARLVPGHDYGSGLRGNSLGYPGAEFELARRAGVFRVAALGDSFAVGPTVAFADNFLTLLESRLPNFEVYNFGVSGAGPREYRAILREDVVRFQPDLVLVCLFVTNDITESLPMPRCMDPRMHALYWLFHRGGKRVPSADEAAVPLPDDHALAMRIRDGTLTRQEYQHLQSLRLAVCLNPAPAGLERKWRRALDDLAGLVGECRRHGVDVGFILIPDEGQVNPAALDEVLQSRTLPRASLELDRPQRRLSAFCQRHGVPCLDLLPAFARRTDLYVPHNTHWNEAGNRLAADKIAAWLESLAPFRRTARVFGSSCRPPR